MFQERIFCFRRAIVLSIDTFGFSLVAVSCRSLCDAAGMSPLLDLLFPRHSLTGAEGAFVTAEECRQIIPDPVYEGTDQLRAHGVQALDALRAAVQYHHCPLVQRAVHTLKYKRVPALHHFLGALLADAVPPSPTFGERPVLCPVPLHWTRRFARGFNQAQLLAEVVAERHTLPLWLLLVRVRQTGHQARRGRSERLTAVQGAFRVHAGSVPQCVILIDDLATTCATLDACAQALKRAGVERVEGWVVARG